MNNAFIVPVVTIHKQLQLCCPAGVLFLKEKSCPSFPMFYNKCNLSENTVDGLLYRKMSLRVIMLNLFLHLGA